jgi:hypothetical protein
MRVGSEGLSLAWLVGLYPARSVAGYESSIYCVNSQSFSTLLNYTNTIGDSSCVLRLSGDTGRIPMRVSCWCSGLTTVLRRQLRRAHRWDDTIYSDSLLAHQHGWGLNLM